MSGRLFQWLPVVLCLLLAGCAGSGGGVSSDSSSKSGSGRYAVDKDGYPDGSIDVSNVPDAVPKVEPKASSGNRPTYQVWGQTYHVLNSARGYSAVGRASFYGTKFQGYATASGEDYDMYRMSAAHKTLPLPTYARVTNLANHRSVIVKVNDRGPFHSDRLIDLSYAAASRLGMLDDGTARVRVTAIDPVAWQRQHNNASIRALASRQSAGESADPGSFNNDNVPSGTHVTASPGVSGTSKTSSDRELPGSDSRYLQVAALGSKTGAETLRARIETRLNRPVRVTQHANLHRVQVGPIHDPIMVESVKSELRDAGFGQSYIVSAKN